MQRLLFFSILLVVGAGVAGCRSGLDAIDELLPLRALEVPFGDYNQLAWLEASSLVVQYEPEVLEQKWTNELWELQLVGGNLSKIDLGAESETECLVVFLSWPTALLDGRLAFERKCTKLGNDGVDIYLQYWNPNSGEYGRLFDYETPTGGSMFSVAPDLSKGILSTGTAIEDELYWLYASGSSRLDLKFARANNPAWSPDGNKIAFFGNVTLRGPAGPNWADQSYDLWIMPADCDQGATGCNSAAKKVLSGVNSPNVLRWSPNGQWLLFDGIMQDTMRGVWVFDVVSAQLRRVAAGDYIDPVWSPDGEQIAVIGPLEQSDSVSYRTTIYVLDFSKRATNSGVLTP